MSIPVKIAIIKNMLSAAAAKAQKAEYGMAAKKDGVRIWFDDGEFEDFVVYKEKTPVFACVIDDGKSFVFESGYGDFKFPKKDTEVLLPGLKYLGGLF